MFQILYWKDIVYCSYGHNQSEISIYMTIVRISLRFFDCVICSWSRARHFFFTLTAALTPTLFITLSARSSFPLYYLCVLILPSRLPSGILIKGDTRRLGWVHMGLWGTKDRISLLKNHPIISRLWSPLEDFMTVPSQQFLVSSVHLIKTY